MASWWFDRWGVLTSANYLFSTLSKTNSGVRTAQGDQFQYRFGDQFNFNVQGMCKLKKGDFAFIPKAGLYFEFQEKDKLNQTELNDSGGSSLFAPVGFDLTWKKLVLQTNVFIPLVSSLNGEQLKNAGMINTGMMVMF